MRFLLFGAVFFGLLSVEAAKMGYFSFPKGIEVTREREKEKELGKYCYKAVLNGKETIVLMAPFKGQQRTVGKTAVKIANSLKMKQKKGAMKGVITLNVGGRAWRGVRMKLSPELMLYSGFTSKKGYIYPLDFVVQGAEISPSARSFFSKIKLLRRVVPSKANSMINKAGSCIARGKNKEAWGYLQKAEKIDSRSATVFLYQGICLMKMRKYREALQAFFKSYEIKQESETLVYMAELSIEAKDYKTAGKFLQKALKVDPENDLAWRKMGKLNYRKRDFDAAVKSFQNALKQNPVSKASIGSLVSLYLGKNKNIEKAAVMLSELKTHYGGDAKAMAFFDQKVKKIPGGRGAIEKLLKKQTGASESTTLDKGESERLAQAQEAFKKLPPLPQLPQILHVAAISTVAPKIDPQKFSKAQYLGVVSNVREAMRQLLGNMSPAAAATFEKNWAAIYDYPAPECIEYLNKAAPLLGRLIALRAAIVKAATAYDKAVSEAANARMFENYAAAHQLMGYAGKQAIVLRSVSKAAKECMKKIEALGDLPDAAALKAAAAASYTSGRRLFRRLKETSKLEGEYRSNLYGVRRDPFWASSTEPDFDNCRPSKFFKERYYIKPLSRVGNLTVVYFYNERVYNKGRSVDKYSTLMLCEKGEDGRLIYYAGGCSLDRIELVPIPEGFRMDEYTLTCNTDDDDEFENKIIPNAAKGKFPAQKLKYFVRSQNFYATGRKLRKIPYAGKIRADNWRGIFRKHHKKEMKNFEMHSKAFATMASKVRFPEPVAPENIFYVLKGIQVTQPPKKKPREEWIGVGSFYDEIFLRSLKDPKNPPIYNVTSLVKENLSFSENKLLEAYSKKVFVKPMNKTLDRLEMQGALSWELPPPVINCIEKVKIPVEAIVKIESPKYKKTLPEHWPVPKMTLKNKQWCFFEKVKRVSPGTKKETKELEFDFENTNKKDIKLIMSFGVFDSAPKLSGPYILLCPNKLTFVYERRFMTPEEARELGSQLRDNMAAYRSRAKKQTEDFKKEQIARKKAEEKVEQQITAMKESLGFHKANILYCKKQAERSIAEMRELRKKRNFTKDDKERLKALQFRVICAQSNAISENDRIRELKTGKYERSETPFDSMCRAQFRDNIRDNMQKMEYLDTQRKKAEFLKKCLPKEQQAKLRESINKIYNEAPNDPKRWEALNSAMKKQWDGYTGQKLAKADEKIAWADAKYQAVSNIKWGADTAMFVCTLYGGPQSLALAYNWAATTAEKGVMEGIKQTVSSMSETVDYAWKAYDGYAKEGWAGAAKSVGTAVLINKGIPFLVGKMRNAGSNGFNHFAEVPNSIPARSTPGFVRKGAQWSKVGSVSGRVRNMGNPKVYRAEMHKAKMQVKAFMKKQAELKAAANKPDKTVEVLKKGVSDLLGLINSNPVAKGYLKYKAKPEVARVYDRTMLDIQQAAIAKYQAKMRELGYGAHKINAFSSGADDAPGTDYDIGISLSQTQQPTRYGKTIAMAQFQQDAQQTWNDSFKNVTGHDFGPRYKCDVPAGQGMTDSVTAGFNNAYLQGEKVALTKVQEQTLVLSKEMCEQLDKAVLPYIKKQLDKIKKTDKSKRKSIELKQLKQLKDSQKRFALLRDAFRKIADGKLSPLRWDNEIRIVTGGRGLNAAVADVNSIVEGLAKK